LINSTVNTKLEIRKTGNTYLRTGKIAVFGMLVTWIQNQSITPVLMYTSGPLIVGYYNMAKMIFMPVGILVSGFSKSVLPQLRRVFQAEGNMALYKKVTMFQNQSIVLTSSYAVAALVLVVILMSYDLIPMQFEHLGYVVCTGVIVSLSTYRFWLSQYFVSRLEFSVLLKAGVLGALTSLFLMFMFDILLGSVILIIFSIIIAESLVILRLRRRVRSLNRPPE